MNITHLPVTRSELPYDRRCKIVKCVGYNYDSHCMNQLITHAIPTVADTCISNHKSRHGNDSYIGDDFWYVGKTPLTECEENAYDIRAIDISCGTESRDIVINYTRTERN